jgi:hypothetical protein
MPLGPRRQTKLGLFFKNNQTGKASSIDGRNSERSQATAKA